MTERQKILYLQQSLAGPRERRTAAQSQQLSPAETRMLSLTGADPDEYLAAKATAIQRRDTRALELTPVRATMAAVMPSMGAAMRRIAISATDNNFLDDEAGEHGPASSDELVGRARDHLDAMDNEADDMSKRERMVRAAKCLMRAIEMEENPGGSDEGSDAPAGPMPANYTHSVSFRGANGIRE